MPSPQPLPFAFDDVDSAPDKPGVYAWYFHSEFSRKDLADLKARLASLDEQRDRLDETREFLHRHLFAPLSETPYEVSVRGALKPRYEGEVPYVPTVSRSLLERVAADPSRLEALDQVLRRAVPHFASPIYIGVAQRSLRSRLRTHRRLIQKYREGLHHGPSHVGTESAAEEMDHSFAWEVAHQRNLHPGGLQVYTLVIDLGGGTALDAENVLNRLNFPLCGRQ